MASAKQRTCGGSEGRDEDGTCSMEAWTLKVNSKPLFVVLTKVCGAFFAYPSKSEEVTYADLNFQYSSKTDNIQKFDNLEKKAPSAPSRVWRMIWALSLLCLLLLIGLGILGSIFYRTSKIEMENFNKLQNLKEELHRTISLQVASNRNISKENLILSATLNIATKLCCEQYKTQKEHKCKPCPEKWMWHEDTCNGLFHDAQTWQNGEMRCSAWNASLLKIKSKSVLGLYRSFE
ncbi:LOW QUALITY PROTEIN: C-type lectin domain family 12 member A [Dugong dugon]